MLEKRARPRCPGHLAGVQTEQREQARANKDWKEADALRAQVREAGYEIDDTPQGPRARPCPPEIDN